MKPSKLFSIGIALATVGLIWLLNIGVHSIWFASQSSSDFAFATRLIMSILMTISGIICVFASLYK